MFALALTGLEYNVNIAIYILYSTLYLQSYQIGNRQFSVSVMAAGEQKFGLSLNLFMISG